MENSAYTTLTRQSGLMREMQVLAHNIANLSTTGFRREGVIFSEFVRRLDTGETPLSMAAANARHTDLRQGALSQTGGAFDFAIEGDGFFRIETPQGERLTRAGHFTLGPDSELLTPDGHRLLDEAGAPVFVPADADAVTLAPDGTLSADGQPLARIGLVLPEDRALLRRHSGSLFEATGETIPAPEARLHQGVLEGSNVDAITEMARLIVVQRAYEQGQAFLTREDERMRAVIQTLGR